MKSIHIFRSGKHTSAGGSTLDFTEEHLQQAAAAYDPAIHEAPIVVGHPKDNGPAFGWIGGLNYSEAGLHADPKQINADFEELVAQGAYKKVSASFYTPESPANPVPGTYYLRHVGFLGAQPPSIKGLEAIGFAENEDGVVEFSADWEVAGVFRRLREFFIEKFGIEDADKAIPDYMVQGAEDIARNPKPMEAAPNPAFSESTTEEKTMTEAEFKAAQDQLTADQAALATQQAALAAEQASFAEQAAAKRKQTISDSVDALVKAGKVLPAKAQAIKDFAEKLDAAATVEFGEGDKAVSQSAQDFLLGLLNEGKSPVNFSEIGAPGEGVNTEPRNSEELAAKAVEYQESERKAGRIISTTQAVNHVRGLE